MTSPHANHPSGNNGGHGHGHGGHGLMMIACCIPMLAIAGGLVIAGVASPGVLLGALACTAMMALMMGGMNAATGEDDSSNEGHGSARR